VNLNKSLSDELNQPKSFPNACSIKKIRKPNKTPNPMKPKNPVGWAFLKMGFIKPGY